ncbi:MAG: S41 family peptidase [Bacteroides sp.]|nr:S41 family peptidase [Bacteroides sp.]MCM1414161.1 S41 family peptidase [Bacteroides sp.]MCM1471289.1 S41 family peptidase [Bacteroides sp.]
MKRTITSVIAALFLCLNLCAQTMSNDSKLRYANKIIERYYVDTINMDSITEEAIRAMLRTLDPHSEYTNREETIELTEPLQGNFSGIGIQFNMVNDTIYVIQPVAGGPCEKVGIVAGDRIISANDSILSGVKKKNTDVMKVLRGPKGSKVNLKVLRRGVDHPIDFMVTRDDIPINSIDAAYMATPTVGYIKLSRFAEKSAEEIEDAIKQLKKQGMRDLIIDLEYNGGGYLNSARDIAGMFLNHGDLIVFTKGDKVPDSKMNSSSGKKFDGKVVIMVNQYSASASEILSGAIQDHDRGVIVGRRTFGKGLVQRPFPFPDGSMIRLTIARYYTPSGRCIQKPYTPGDEDSYAGDILSRYQSGELTSSDSVHLEGLPKFETLVNHRPVYGGGGIMPDIFVAIDTTASNDYSRDLLARGIYNNFCINYIDEHRKELKKQFRTEDQFVSEFRVDYSLMKQFRNFAAKEGVEAKDEQQFLDVAPTIATIIKAYIGRDMFTQSTYYRIVNNISNEYREALRIITDDDAYYKILTGNDVSK